MDSMEDRVKHFFKKCQPVHDPKQEWKDDQYKQIKNVRFNFFYL